MNTIFEESGGLNIDDFTLQQPSFLKFLEYGIITKEYHTEQRKRVITLLKKFEQSSTSANKSGM